MAHPFFERETRAPVEGPFAAEELGLAFRNVGLPLEALRYDVTPLGMHYTLSHFDVPEIDAGGFRLAVGGAVEAPLSLRVDDLKALAPPRTLRVTLECAGNGRAGMTPRYPSMPWQAGGVGTAEWTGVALRHLLALARLGPAVTELAFVGADRGFDSGVEHAFGRSLPRALALDDDVILAWEMNGRPLPPQHGAPLRLVVPGWFGMASVKWLDFIEAREQPYDGYQQAVGYHYRKQANEPGVPITHAKVKSLMAPPGIPDWYTRRRLADRGRITVTGRAWSGAGTPIERVQFAVDGEWRYALLAPAAHRYAWQRWECEWDATPGEHELACRATDASGATQPMVPEWNRAGMGNNAVQVVQVTVR
ncbi:MAG TPA: sulfite oxidase [Burkholderiales bacterium]|nr:sulfite oxidase [Burkholderiales bacterium]